MTRYVKVMWGVRDRDEIDRILDAAPKGTRVEIKDPKRTVPQNAMMWLLLSEIALQKTHHGRRYTPDQWKAIFMHAIGREITFIPSLEGETIIPWGNRSSDLSKAEMSDLIEFIKAWGAEHGVEFRHEPVAA